MQLLDCYGWLPRHCLGGFQGGCQGVAMKLLLCWVRLGLGLG